MSEKLNFRDIQLEDIGRPTRVEMMDDNTAIILDWEGYLTVFDLISNKIANQVYLKYPYHTGNFNYLSIHANKQGDSREVLCAIAPQHPRFIIWRAGEETCEHHSTETGGSVRSVAFSPSGKYLAVGLGFYSLTNPRGSRHHRADLEIWDFEGEKPRCHYILNLPGISVDAICWRYDGKEIACVTGFRHQRGGVITLIDEYLCPYAFIELLYPFAKSISYMDYLDQEAIEDSSIEYVEPSSLVVSHSEGVEAISLEGDDYRDLVAGPLLEKNYRTRWFLKDYNRKPGYTSHIDFTYNPYDGKILLTDGRLLYSNGHIISQLQLLEECISVAYRPEGGYLGISKKGILRCWEKPPGDRENG